jgi:hypothetical protein
LAHEAVFSSALLAWAGGVSAGMTTAFFASKHADLLDLKAGLCSVGLSVDEW